MTTSFARLHGSRFGSAVRSRGADYLRLGLVEITDLTEQRVAATVLGSSKFEVEIRAYRDPRRVVLSCTCPNADGGFDCKHMWAVLLAVDDIEAGISAWEDRMRSEPGAETTRGKAAAGFAANSDDDGPLAERVDGSSLPASAQGRRVGAPKHPAKVVATPRAPSPPAWRQRLERIALARPPAAEISVPTLEYEVSPGLLLGDSVMSVQMRARFPLKDGSLGVPRMADLPRHVIQALPAADRELLTELERAGGSLFGRPVGTAPMVSLRSVLSVKGPDLERVLRSLAATGRVLAQLDPMRPAEPVRVDADPPFRFRLVLLASPAAGARVRRVAGAFVRDERVVPSEHLGRVARHDARLVGDTLVRLECGEAVELANELALGPIEVDVDEVGQVLGALARLPGAREFLGDLVAQLPVVAPTGVLLVTFPKDEKAPLPVRLRFDYGGELIDVADERPLLETAEGPRRRDGAAEQSLRERVAAALGGLRGDHTADVPRAALPQLTQALATHGVRVLAEGRRLRAFQFGSNSVATGVDWFEIAGSVAFDELRASLPELLKKPVTPEGFVELGDGSLGMLPTTWLRRLEALRALGGVIDDDVMRVPSSRGLLLDALLSAQELDGVTVDAAFAALRQRFRAFAKIEARREPATFAGELRPYQREGLGWLAFLREFGLGGCLADDMGLGKTVQVLAHLCATREAAAATGKRRQPARPHLLVAPRSVLGNWLAEAARFAPSLRVLDFGTADRWRDGADERLREHDLVLTTYAMLRVDAPQFVERGIAFDHAILDEAQAVKNPDSQSSKAVRLVSSRHRLVLTGTPVENHLGDLWSLFEFLNPGMLGRLPAFRALFGKGSDSEAMREHRELVQRALRPVLLRRTKQQVLKDLPEKVDQTLWCELGPGQRKRYDALRAHYRQVLLGGAGELDDQQRFVVLEALLRLRQAACHEALLPGVRATDESAKFDELLPRLEELAAEGHKALVFSQFTAVLDLLEPKLQALGIAFERLDGKTTKRAERVARFQAGQTPVFLISLKAGGFGLNLTAASYVFVLDPWWNPAAEMQAIDRAHRIGQKRVVNAYRLVCRGTVEERVLELQQRKKALSDAILGQERSLLQDLTRADLELLLG